MSEKDKPAGAGFFGTKELLKKYKKDTPGESVKEVYKNSGLGKWFGQSAGGEAGWDRYNTKGERVGKCGDSKPGEGKPKCLSPKKARQLRAQGGKKAIGNAAKRKKAQDPNTDRPGTGNKPINVSNNIKKEDRDMKSAKEFLNDMINEQINEDLLNEKNKPTNPALWAKSISAAKSKFEVYPSAYANAWASKHYKAAGGGWESTNEETELDEALKVRKNDGPFTVVALKGGKVVDTFRGAEHGELKDVVAFSKANNKGAKISVEAKGGKVVHTEGFEIDDELIDLDLSEAKKKRITKLHGKYPKGTHYCATHVEHAEFGHGNPIHSQHAAPDEFGDIDWYDVMFEHGIEQGVATDDLQIHLGEAHYDHVEHDHPGEDLEEGEFDSRKSAEEIRLRTKYRMSKDGGKDGKPYSPADMHGAMDSLHRKKARTSGVRRLGSQHPSNKKLNLTVGEAMGPGIAHKDGLKDAQKTDSMQRYYAQVKKDQAARAKQIEQERKDGIRSKYESVEQVDELRRDTLGSYADKAQGDIEGIGNVLKAKGKKGPVSAKHRAELERELRNRVKGRKRAIGKKYNMNREDVEQVDELDTKTMKSYIKKAMDNNQKRAMRFADQPSHAPADKDEMRKLRKRNRGVAKAKTDVVMRKIAGKDYRSRMGEDIELDELKMPAKDAKGRIKDPTIRKAYKQGQLIADLKADKKLRNKDAEGAEGHLKRSQERRAKSRTPVEEAKVGDTVHLGHATKGGSGVKGKVVKIDGNKVHIKNDKGAMFKGPMDRVTVGEAIKYDSAGDSTGTVTGKGKRDRGPKGSRTSGEVKVKYKGSDTYKDGAKLPIKANDIGRLIKTARKKNTKPYDSRNLRNPRLTRDHVEHGVDEGMMDKAKKAAKMLGKPVPRDVHNPGRPTKKSAGDIEASRREKARRDSIDRRAARDKEMLNNREGVEDMTAAQERDRQHRDNPTRKTVAGVRLPSTDKERASYVKKFQADKAGKPGNTKPRKMRDLQMRLRGPK